MRARRVRAHAGRVRMNGGARALARACFVRMHDAWGAKGPRAHAHCARTHTRVRLLHAAGARAKRGTQAESARRRARTLRANALCARTCALRARAACARTTSGGNGTTCKHASRMHAHVRAHAQVEFSCTTHGDEWTASAHASRARTHRVRA
eukprot:4291381-Pleurochrysis_carterae.AAC.1